MVKLSFSRLCLLSDLSFPLISRSLVLSCWLRGFFPRIGFSRLGVVRRRPGFSTSQDDLGKTKTSGQDPDKVLLKYGCPGRCPGRHPFIRRLTPMVTREGVTDWRPAKPPAMSEATSQIRPRDIAARYPSRPALHAPAGHESYPFSFSLCRQAQRLSFCLSSSLACLSCSIGTR